MATVDRHPDSRFYRARFTGPDGKRICRTLKTEDRAVALKMAADLELTARQARAGILTTERGRAVVNEILTAAGQPPLEIESTRSFCDRWLAPRREPRPRARSGFIATSCATSSGTWGPSLTGRSPRSCLGTLRGFGTCWSRLGAGPPRSLKEVFQVSGIFGLAVRQGHRPNPAAMIELDNAAGQTREPFTAADVKALLNHAEGEWVTVILLGAYTGMRIGDAAISLGGRGLGRCRDQVYAAKNQAEGQVLTIPLHPTLEAHLGRIAGDVGGPVCPTLARVGD